MGHILIFEILILFAFQPSKSGNGRQHHLPASLCLHSPGKAASTLKCLGFFQFAQTHQACDAVEQAEGNADRNCPGVQDCGLFDWSATVCRAECLTLCNHRGATGDGADTLRTGA